MKISKKIKKKRKLQKKVFFSEFTILKCFVEKVQNYVYTLKPAKFRKMEFCLRGARKFWVEIGNYIGAIFSTEKI